MHQGENRLRLKVKKRDRSSIDILKTTTTTINTNFTNQQQQQQRSNPFSNHNAKKRKTSNDHENSAFNKDSSSLLSKLSSIDTLSTKTSSPIVQKTSTESNEPERTCPVTNDGIGNLDEKSAAAEVKKEFKYVDPAFPLDWGIKQKVQLISKKPLEFCSSLKSTDKAESLKKFASTSGAPCEDAHFYQYLCNWVHPSIPSVPNFPVKRTLAEKINSKDESSTSTINSNAVFQVFRNISSFSKLKRF